MHIGSLTKGISEDLALQGTQANAIGPGCMLTDKNETLMSNPEFDVCVKGGIPACAWRQR